MRSILMSQKMITKTSQNDHKISFWAILMKFICDLKIDIIMVEPHHVKYFFKTPSTVQCFDFLTFDILYKIDNFDYFLLEVFGHFGI